MGNIQEKSLVDCLSYLGLRDLPQEWDKETVYLLAVGLVAKADGTHSYVALKKDINGNDKIVKDFGTVSALKGVEKVYAYQYLDSRYMPIFKTKTKDERIEWLQKMGETSDLSELSIKELNKKVLNMAMQLALRTLNKK